MKRGKKHDIEFVDPIASFTPGDAIVLQTGQRIELEGGDQPGGILSVGDGSSVTLEAGAGIESDRDGDVGILSVGADTSVDIEGFINLAGANSVGASVRDGLISLSGELVLDGDGSNGLVLNQPDAHGAIAARGSIEMNGDSAAAVFAVRSDSVVNDGEISTSGAYSTGIFSGDGEVVNTGSIISGGDGSSGIYAAGASQITNIGVIEATGEALPSVPGNEGSAAGIYLNWDGAVVTNSGRISSDHDAGIEVDPGAGLAVFGFPPPPADTTNTIINEHHGRISGEVGIRGSDYVEVVENAGVIDGGIEFGGGDDVYQAVGNGRTNGVIDGGDGNDTLIAGHGRDTLLGGDGNDLLDGGRSSDVLDGGAGDDVLIGGRGGDLFIFNGGNDIILDMSAADELELQGYSLSDAEVEINGEDVTYRWTTSDSLTVVGGADDAPLAKDFQTQEPIYVPTDDFALA